MNTKNLLGIAAMIAAAVFAVQVFYPDQAEAKQSATATQATLQAVEFARLQVEAEDSVTWLVGGNGLVRTESVRATYRRLGGRASAPGTFSDLLNQIGSEGWNLAEKDGDVWIFSRPTS